MPLSDPPEGYRLLVKRLNKFPQGAPPSHLLYRILALLVDAEEAELLSRLPLRPFTVASAAAAWRLPQRRARAILEALAGRGMLLDMEHEGSMVYVLPPPMAGFFEFSLMRVRSDLDQQELSRLFYQYLNVEEEFVRELFAGGRTQLGRIFVNELALPPESASRVLDYERASEVIRSASDIAVGLCYCRHKMRQVGRGCDAPPSNCLTLNVAAASLIRHGTARRIEAAEGVELLDQARSLNLVQCGDNVRQGVNFICLCCRCCCEALIAVRRLALPRALYTTNFLPACIGESCTGCGRCTTLCPVDAIAPPEGSAHGEGVRVNEELCLGCGVCVRGCPRQALVLRWRGERMVTPVNSAHRVVLMAIERGTLQHLIFHNQAHLSHRTMAAILGAILRLPPVKRLLAARQLNSRFLEHVFACRDVASFTE